MHVTNLVSRTYHKSFCSRQPTELIMYVMLDNIAFTDVLDSAVTERKCLVKNLYADVVWLA